MSVSVYESRQAEVAVAGEVRRMIKLVVWDLDETLWHGALLEDGSVRLREGVVETVQELDRRGILQSIASKNDYDHAMSQLRRFGLAEYFLYPQIHWGSKAASLKTIASSINVGLDAVAFIDDQEFERDEVAFSLPEVNCIDPAEMDGLLDRADMSPRFITKDSGLRRFMYINDLERKKAEEAFVGSQEEFLATLKMDLGIGPAGPEDLDRAEELTLRTNQLNSTGYTYSYDELNEFLQSERHKLLIASLTDKYGTYGKIGLALIEREQSEWTIKLLLVSCRVISKGVGTILINYIMKLAKEAKVRLRAEYAPNGRNRMMYVSYKFANFHEAARHGDLIIFENDLSRIQNFPPYMKVKILD